MNKRILLIISVVLLSAHAACAEQPARLSRLAELYNQGKFDEAVAGYRIAAESGDLAASLDCAVILKDLGNYDEAVLVLRRQQGKSGDDPRIGALLARLYYLNGKPDRCLKVLAPLRAADPANVSFSVLAGLCYESLGDEENARGAFEKAASIDKKNVVARLSLAQLYYRQNRLQESEESFKKVNILDSSINKIYRYWGDVLFQLGNYREAFRVYEKLQLLEPRNAAARQKVAQTREKLGQQFFDGQHEKVVTSRRDKSLFVVPAKTVEGAVMVRVGLVQGCEKPINFKCSTPFEIKDKGDTVFEGKPGAVYEIKAGEGMVSVSDESGWSRSSSGFRIRPRSPEGCLMFFALATGKGNFWSGLQDRSFRGTIELSAADIGLGGFTVVNTVTLEEYLYSVVPSEMFSSWPMEALKAQAVAARSEAMRKLGRHKNDGFDFCPEVHCQSYYGVERETATTRAAVDETCGIIMTYNGKPVDAIYSSTCGGHTQDNIFGDGTPIPYLKGITDVSDDARVSFPLSPFGLENWLREPPKGILCDVPEYLNSSCFRWVRMYSAEELGQIVAKTKNIGPIRKVVVIRRNASGHAVTVKIKGSEGVLTVEKEAAVRKTLGDLRSSLFMVEVKYGADKLPEQFIFYGGGWGHGVGLCQAGACNLAAHGKEFKDILHHYFDKVEFRKLY